MPWCDACDAYRPPTALSEDGSCATCGSGVDTTDVDKPAPVNAPWHFWVMVVGLVLYLGWRLVDAAIWLLGRL